MRMAEVSAKFGLTQDTLRYYERIGLIPPVNRNSSGIREYTEADLRWVDYIKCMRIAGLSIETLTEYVALFQQGDITMEARKELLVKQRDQLLVKMEEIKNTVEHLDRKINRYEQTIYVKEQQLSST